MRKILYISGTRADYGLMRETLFRIRSYPGLKIELALTGMHLMPEFGKTINEIKKDRFRTHIFKAIYENDNRKSVVGFTGKFILSLVENIQKINPDIILILGDRAEMLAGAITGAYLSIPVVHIHGGDVTSTIDDSVRNAITKLSHIHLAATRKSGERLIKMGEEPWRVHVVGAPGLCSILNKKALSKDEIARKYNLNLSRPILLVIQHPVTMEVNEVSRQIKETMDAVSELGYQAIVVYPNADPGGRKIINIIERYKKYPFIQLHKSIPHDDYLSLMRIVAAIVGNSSSGIIESPSFHLPFVNIGTRQEGRERNVNVIDVGYIKSDIKEAIKKAVYDRDFKARVRRCKSLYGDGKADEKITRLLTKIKIDNKLLQKRMTY